MLTAGSEPLQSQSNVTQEARIWYSKTTLKVLLPSRKPWCFRDLKVNKVNFSLGEIAGMRENCQ